MDIDLDSLNTLEPSKLGKIRSMFKEIQSHLDRGVSYKRIASHLTSKGFPISNKYLSKAMAQLREEGMGKITNISSVVPSVTPLNSGVTVNQKPKTVLNLTAEIGSMPKYNRPTLSKEEIDKLTAKA